MNRRHSKKANNTLEKHYLTKSSIKQVENFEFNGDSSISKSISEKLKGQIYIDPRLDTGFKNLFASKAAIKDFLNGILQLQGEDRIKDLNYSFDHTLRFMAPRERKISLDAFATTESKRFLNIEMQKAEHNFFIDRTVLYKSFLIINGKQEMESTEEFKALSKEQKEYRRYEIPESISIWICDFELPQTMGNYIDEWAIYSRESLKNGNGETIFPKNKYIIVSLPKFNKTADEVKTPVDTWLYVIKHACDGKELPHFGSDIVKEALERIRIDRLDNKTLTELEREMIAQEEIDCRLAGAKIETRLEMVDAMLANDIPVEKISVISGIPLEEIQKRRALRERGL